MPAAVVLAYADLANPDADVSDLLEEVRPLSPRHLLPAAAPPPPASPHSSKWRRLLPPCLQAFGPAGLGICTVSGVPGLPELRQQLLPLALQFAGLPEGVRQRYEDPASRFNVGWSCGRETLEGGRPDTGKGSFYANPLVDTPTTDPALLASYPSYCRPNLWPRGELPQLEAAFKALGRLIIQVGLLLTRHCDKYLAARGHPPRLAGILEQSPCPKGEGMKAGGPQGVDSRGCPPASWSDSHMSAPSLHPMGQGACRLHPSPSHTRSQAPACPALPLHRPPAALLPP